MLRRKSPLQGIRGRPPLGDTLLDKANNPARTAEPISRPGAILDDPMSSPARAPLTAGKKGRLVLIGLWAAIAVALVVFRRALLPFAIALVIAYLLEPAVGRLSRLRLKGRALPRWTAVIALYILIFFLIYLFSTIAVPQLYGELAGLIRGGKRFFNSLTPQRIAEISKTVEQWLLSRGIPVELVPPSEGEPSVRYGLSFDLEQSLREGLDKLSLGLKTHFLDAVGLVQRLVQGVLGFVFRFFFILMVAAFVLVDWSRLGRYARSLIPPERHADFDALLLAIDKRLAGVVRGQAVICLINGTLTAIGLVILRVPFVFVLSILATVLSAIPIFGTIISSVPIVLIALTHGFHKGLLMLAWILGIHALEAYVLNPKIMRSHAQIHPVLVAFALLAGEVSFGFVGALFAVPVAGVLSAIFEAAHERALGRIAQSKEPESRS
jgi:predicted PurR-regulated permease PerM